MPLPIALISALAPVVTRLYDKKKPLGKTNVSTAAGGTLMGTAIFMMQQPDHMMQGIGYVLAACGFLITMYKEKK